ncbi:MAG TPA: class I SAM-dependent methyltransferase [Candidatus Limnocylindrales bacterium]|nr:class I SAM-dependent methyltransferase [Candidatus Limnocylindrales bacterium]
MIVDLGTGDGRGVLVAAAADPLALVVGIDADAASMAEASRRAARPERKGGRPNALFLAAGIEALDPVLDGCADLVTVTLPWGSLLRGALGLDAAAACAIARVSKPRGRVEMLVSVTPRDGVAGLPCLEAETIHGVAARYAELGLCMVEALPATANQIAASGSTWAKRLLATGSDRDFWRLVLRRMNPA